MKYKSIYKKKNINALDIIINCGIIFSSEIVKYNLNKKYDITNKTNYKN